MCMIYKSRYTPGLETGKDVGFDIGEVVKYKTANGIVDITIDSELCKHKDAPGDQTGYECIFHDRNKREFAARSRIIDWEGHNKADC